MTTDRGLLLSAISGFPAGEVPTWTLGKLLDRTDMVAQFDLNARTLDKAMLRAFEGVVGPEPDFTDDEGRLRWLAYRSKVATACRDAVMKHLGVKVK